MAKQKYALNPGEKIVYKTSCVRHGFWGAYTHALTITNQSVILEKYGMLNNFKGIERYNYIRMAYEYESEQKELVVKVAECEKQLVELQKQTVDMKMLYQGLSEFTEMKELTPLVVNKLIERIEIHNNEKKHSHNNVKVDIYFTAIGLFDIPTEQELLKAVEELKNHKQHTEKSA